MAPSGAIRHFCSTMVFLLVTTIMPKKTIVVDFSELLHHAVECGFDWNNACDFLDGLRPQYEVNQIECYKSDITSDAYGYGEEAQKVVLSFFEKHKLTEFTIVND